MLKGMANGSIIMSPVLYGVKGFSGRVKMMGKGPPIMRMERSGMKPFTTLESGWESGSFMMKKVVWSKRLIIPQFKLLNNLQTIFF